MEMLIFVLMGVCYLELLEREQPNFHFLSLLGQLGGGIMVINTVQQVLLGFNRFQIRPKPNFIKYSFSMSAATHPSTLIQEAQLMKKAYFQSPNNHLYSQNFQKMVKIVEGLTIEDFNIPEQFPSIPTEGVVLKEFGLRISLFFIPKGTKTLLHDHPSMYVINKILKGSFKKYQYTLLNSEFQQNVPKNYLNNPSECCKFQFPIIQATRLTQTISTGHIDIVTPQDNLHRFQTTQNSIFIDVIAPDYDGIQIFYNTYQQLQSLPDGKVRLQMGAPKLQQNYMIKIEMK